MTIFRSCVCPSERTRVELEFSTGAWSPTIGLSNHTNHSFAPHGLPQRQLVKVRGSPDVTLPGPNLAIIGSDSALSGHNLAVIGSDGLLDRITTTPQGAGLLNHHERRATGPVRSGSDAVLGFT
jgi:hypothetical protein